MRSRRRRWWPLLVLAVVVFCGATRYYPLTVLNPVWLAYDSSAYNAALRNGPVELEAVRQFVDLFPGAEHQITYFTGESGSPSWTSSIGLHGRYVLSVQVPIRLNWSRRHVTATGDATYFWNEIESVSVLASGGVSTTSKHYRQFGPGEWQALYRSGGDFRTIGVEIRTDRPVAHFDRAWRLP